MVWNKLFGRHSSSIKSSALDKRFYDFAVNTADGTPLDMNQFIDKVVIAVNVATQCGYTANNYAQFKTLLDLYYDKGLRILLFPCNQFGSQEPGEACSIAEANMKRDPRFITTEKIDVNGSNEHPLFGWLKKGASGFLVDAVKWNFTKFLVDRQGHVHPKRFAPNDEPLSMVADIEKLI